MDGKTSSIPAFQCLRCSRVSFPRHTRCRSCRGSEFKEVSLTRGRIITSTTLTATRPGFAGELVLAVAEFEHGVRVLGQVRAGGVSPLTGVYVTVGEGILGHDKDQGELKGFMFIPERQPE